MHSLYRRARPIPCFFFLVALVAQAQAPAKAAPRRGLLWKATSPTTTVYLLGSVHVAEKSIYPLAKPIEDAFAGSKIVAVEVNVIRDKDKMAAMIQSRAIYSDGSSLSRHIRKSTSDELDAFCRENAVPRSALEPMKPWMVELFVSLLPLQRAGIDENQGIDLHFLNAVGEQQRIEELETAQFQADLVASGTEAEQDEALADSLKHSGEALGFMRKIQTAFIEGNVDAVQKLVDESNTGPKSRRQRFLEDRNPAMADKIDRYLKGNEQVFVMVGAAHLIGPHGIVQLLRDRNYKVEQVLSGE